jgi:exodeoxyribonuclease VII small subunit
MTPESIPALVPAPAPIPHLVFTPFKEFSVIKFSPAHHPSLNTEYFRRLFHWTFTAGFLIVSSVAISTKNAGQNASAKAPNLAFEEALKKLESIVEAMESEDLPLESLLAKYEEGTQLAKSCQEKLAEAELKVQQLEKTAGGDLKLKAVTADLGE